MSGLPRFMQALRYEKPEVYSIVEVPLPQLGNNDVLVRFTWLNASIEDLNAQNIKQMKVKASGVCGTDLHIHEGDFFAAKAYDFPLIPGHEAVGVVAALGKDVKGLEIGQRIVTDANHMCHACFYCRRGQLLLCENFEAIGVTMSGAFAEYCAVSANKVFPIHSLNDIDATLIEPASCAAHGLSRISPKIGSSVLIFGAGPTGLMLAQLLQQNGGCHVVIASLEDQKLALARKLGAADEFVGLPESGGEKELEKLKNDNPYGFDIVVEATGVPKVCENAINYVRRGGKLLVYGVYPSKQQISWSPSKIFGDEITIIGSFSETYMFPTALAYLDSGKVKTEGIVNAKFRLDEWGKCIAGIKARTVIKAVIVFD